MPSVRISRGSERDRRTSARGGRPPHGPPAGALRAIPNTNTRSERQAVRAGDFGHARKTWVRVVWDRYAARVTATDCPCPLSRPASVQ